MPLISSIDYRPEIDGLRAVSVLAVVLFHAGLGVTGGYIGVDVFFVVSGFLITSLIVRDLENGKFTLAGFWERRARRIIPAMVVVVLATLAAGWFLLLPADYTNLGRSVLCQAVFGANFYFWSGSGYFAGPAEEKPLLHTWSLAVEEQFYMIVPLLLFSLFLLPAFRRRGFLLSLFATSILLSLLASIYGVNHHPSATFYLLPTRAWELLCGALVALVPVEWTPRRRIGREVFSIVGLAGIVIPCFLYTKTTPFPGIAAIPPCVGTAIFIWACSKNRRSIAESLPAPARLLAWSPVVFVGLISYSLYLWHWPLFTYSNYCALEPRTVGWRLLLVGISFLLAVISWRFVETPFRRRSLCASRRAMFAFAALGMASVLISGGTVLLGRGFPSRVPAKAIEYASARDDEEGSHELKAEDIRAGRLIQIGNPGPRVPVSMLLWGDSHAMAASPAFDQFLKERGLSGRQATASATAPVLDAYWDSEFKNPESAKAFNAAVFDYIKRERIPNVVLAGYWEHYTDDRGTDRLDAALLSTVERLVAVGTRPVILLQVPHHRFVPPRGLAMASIFNYDLTSSLAKPTESNGLYGEGDSLLKRIEAAGGRILDPRPCFLDATRQHFIAEKDGSCLYRDAHHLSAKGAKLMLVPFLRESLDFQTTGHDYNSEYITRHKVRKTPG